MLVTCILISHNKPDLCHEAIQSVMDQSHHQWECLVVDSGVLYDQGYFQKELYSRDERIKVIRSTETDLTRKTKAMAPWCFNECFRQQLVNGELVMYLCDDDILYSNAFETFVKFAQQHTEALAMYASQDIGVIFNDGRRKIVGQRLAKRMAGRICKGVKLDCKVDYLQFCHRRVLLDQLSTNEWWPENKDTESHADGIFMENCGALTPIYPINVKVSQNRRAPSSLNHPTDQFLKTWKGRLLSYFKPRAHSG